MHRRLILVPRVEGDSNHLGILLADFLRVLLNVLVALEDALLRGVPHQLPLHHWLVKILRLEVSIGAEAGHLAQLLPPRHLPVEVAGVALLPSVQLHHASIEPQVRHRHLVLGEGACLVRADDAG